VAVSASHSSHFSTTEKVKRESLLIHSTRGCGHYKLEGIHRSSLRKSIGYSTPSRHFWNV